MGIACLVLGKSGSGKSTSMRNFNESDVRILNVASKPLPFRNVNKLKNEKLIVFVLSNRIHVQYHNNIRVSYQFSNRIQLRLNNDRNTHRIPIVHRLKRNISTTENYPLDTDKVSKSIQFHEYLLSKINN